MKCVNVAALLLVSLVASDAAANTTTPKHNREVTKIVEMLEKMLEKSKRQGKKEREVYAKLKCEHDKLNEENTQKVEELTTEIGLLESGIEELRSSTGLLSTESAKLQKDIEENKKTREDAKSLRKKEKDAFDEKVTDSQNAISQISSAVEKLSAVGADQTLEAAADHNTFMASRKVNGRDVSLANLHASVKEALHAATAFMTIGQKRITASFLQSVPTGNGIYTAQSGEVVGILKDMRDTFEADLDEARSREKKAATAYEELMREKRAAHKDMTDLYDQKQSELGGNDGDLASKIKSLEIANFEKEETAKFLAEDNDMYEKKTKEYEHRRALRDNEDAAIAEAIAILDNDAAFTTFGKVQSTSIGRSTGFLQLSAVRLHANGEGARRARALKFLAGSTRLVQLAAKLRAGNPFKVVLQEMEKMKGVIEEERQADTDKREACRKERRQLKADGTTIGEEIIQLEGLIEQLGSSINDKQEGLKVTIASSEKSLLDNSKSQEEATANRKKEAETYQENVASLHKAKPILQRAIQVLKAFYGQLENARDDSSEGQEGAYEGQSEKGSSVIKLLEFVLSETEEEEKQAHEDEKSSKIDYDHEMSELTKHQRELEEGLVNLKETLAGKEAELFNAKKDLRDTKARLKATDATLLSIKPGCDFIETNFDLREKSRQEEEEGLKRAGLEITRSPAFAIADAAQEDGNDRKKM